MKEYEVLHEVWNKIPNIDVVLVKKAKEHWIVHTFQFTNGVYIVLLERDKPETTEEKAKSWEVR